MVLYDASGLVPGTVTLTPGAMFLVTLMNGQNTLNDIAARFAQRFKQPLPIGQLVGMLHQLDRAGMLDSPVFEARYEEMTRRYRQAPERRSQTPMDPGAVDKLRSDLTAMLSEGQVVTDGQKVVGLLAPHLDYARGRPCYASAYAQLRGQEAIDRFVILGTNHFGRSTTAVWTTKDYHTPLGVARTDREFLRRLQERCGADLGERELDHLREHSAELQVMVLQALRGSQPFEIVPVLCPDACGPTGLDPADGIGPGLDTFADALADVLSNEAATNGKRTCVIAGADLSHVGRRFGDDRDLDDAFLHAVEQQDRAALARIQAGDADGLVADLRAAENPYRVCSGGCLYVLLRVLRGSQVRMLSYHQAVDREHHTGVTCAAAVLVK